jgi:hypothetical protein
MTARHSGPTPPRVQRQQLTEVPRQTMAGVHGPMECILSGVSTGREEIKNRVPRRPDSCQFLRQTSHGSAVMRTTENAEIFGSYARESKSARGGVDEQ